MMLDKLWRLEWQSTTMRAHNRTIERLKRAKASQDEIEGATQNAMWENGTFRDEIEGAKSSRLISQANRLGLPTPKYNFDESAENPEWDSGYPGKRYLSRTAQSELQSRIRQEKKESREVIAFWIKDIRFGSRTSLCLCLPRW
jgi:hypothetical protein